ncbi:MAG: hypothetical protein JWN73_199 [Betaproteobacteria bacterium]|nr:hypothetical protein [Betaproteobacteria bacterium]
MQSRFPHVRTLGALLLTMAAAGCAGPNNMKGPLVLKDMGSFHVGGREVTISGKPVKEVRFTATGAPAKVDPNGVYQVEQMYVQYFIPQNQRGALPILMWHGGGLTGVTYESTPDGRPGWLNYFLRQGWAVYNSDAVERGRSGFASPDVFQGEPVFLTKANPFERFRIGQGPGSYDPDPAKMKVNPGSQFPVEAYDNFAKQGVPRWLTTDDAIIRAYIALVDKVCPCIVLAHSQGGPFAFKVAQARPDTVKALILAEPAGTGDMANAAALKNTPILTVYGDYVDQDARWPVMRKSVTDDFYGRVRAAGGKPEVVNLPELGIKGNSHMMMMDRNNLQIAGIMQDWLKSKGFYQ